jgi:tetratricopeptide (TPR) repeat protein
MMHGWKRRILRIATVLMSAVGSACSQATPGPASGIDSRRAFLRLEQIEPAPRLPPAAVQVPREPEEAAVRYLRKGREHLDQQLWVDATIALEKALQVDPQLVEARVLLARACMQNGNNTLAESHLREALKTAPADPAVHQLLGEIAWQANRAAEAITEFRLALLGTTSDPTRPERTLAQLSLAMALRKEGYLTAAIDQLEAYLAAVERPTPAMLKYRELADAMVLFRGRAPGLIGEIASELGRHDLAAKAYERALRESPDDAGLAARCARALAAAGRGEEAIRSARSLLADRPEDPEGLALLRELCGQVGGTKRFDDEVAGLARSTASPGLRMRLTQLLVERGRLEEAAAVLDAVVAGNPGDVEANCLAARLRLQRGQAEEALRLLASVLAAEPSAYRRAEDVLGACSDAGCRGRLIEAAKALCEQAPGEAAAQYLLGRVLAAAGKAEEAAAAYERAVRLKESFGPAWAAKARALVGAKRWAEAVSAADSAIRQGVRDADVYLMKGEAHQALDEFEEAETALLASFDLERKSALPVFRLAMIMERRGDRRRCESLYRRILEEVDSRFVPARERLVRLYLNSDKLDKARDYFSDFSRLGLRGPEMERCAAMVGLATSKTADGEKRLEEYREALRRVAREWPGEAATQVDLATSYIPTGELEPALKHIEEAIRLAPDELRARELKVTLLEKLLDNEGAAQVVRDLLVDRPNDPGYHAQLLNLALNEGNYGTAIELMDGLIRREKDKPRRSELERRRIGLLLAARRHDQAIESARAWWQESPKEASRRSLYLDALTAAGRHGQAVDQASRWWAEDPTNVDLRAEYIQKLRLADRLGEARQKVLAWLEKDADDTRLNGMLIALCWAMKDWDAAAELAQTGVEVPADRERYQNWLGQTYVLGRRFDEAVRFYRERARALETDNAYSELIAVLTTAERYEEAEQVVNSLLAPQLARRDAGEGYSKEAVVNLRRRLASIHQFAGQEARATQQLEEIYKLDPADPGVNNDLGYTWADAGRNLARAEKMIRFAVSERPRESAYLDSLGWVLYKQGRLDEARKYLERAVRLMEVDDPVYFDHLGDCLYRIGRKEEARQAWDRAEKILAAAGDTPQNPENRRVGDRLKAKLEQVKQGAAAEPAPLAPAASRPAGAEPGRAG